MSSTLRNSVFILTLAILLPIAIFTGVEIASLNENESMLEQVYREQLDGVIFSINQYGADLYDFYIQQIDYSYEQGGISTLANPSAIKGNLAIEFIAINDANNISSIDLNNKTLIDLNYDSIFNANESLINRLIRYKQTDYIKQEVLTTISSNNEPLQVSLIIIGETTPCLVFVNPISFIQDLLAPKIQQITTQSLNISITDSLTSDTTYRSAEAPIGIVQKGRLAKIPNYEIAISLKTQSVSELIAFRTKRNLLALVSMVTIVIFGMVLIIKNFRKEAQLNKVKADFIANVSHEIRTPLSLISMFNESLLLGRVNEAKRQEYYEIISKETSRLKSIVNKILSFSQIDANKKVFKFSEFDPSKKLEEVLNSYSYHLNEKGFDYKIKIQSHGQIMGDEEAFSEVIINLLDNAMKYSKESKYIEVETLQIDNKYIISIKDQGVGIEIKHQKSIFDKFFRIDAGDVHNTKGTGLGLALVAEIMKEHNATIEVDSKLGKGSTFTLKFPII